MAGKKKSIEASSFTNVEKSIQIMQDYLKQSTPVKNSKKKMNQLQDALLIVRLTNTTVGHNKFYEIYVKTVGTKFEMWTKHGKIGSTGVVELKTKSLSSTTEALQQCYTLRDIKLKKGYLIAQHLLPIVTNKEIKYSSHTTTTTDVEKNTVSTTGKPKKKTRLQYILEDINNQ